MCAAPYTPCEFIRVLSVADGKDILTAFSSWPFQLFVFAAGD